MLDGSYAVNLTAMDLKDVRTPADLWKLAQSRRKA
jgi:hypothetical protein